VVRSGASWHALNRADVQVALYSLTSNGTTSHSVGARADIALNRVTLIGGTVLGVHGFELGGTGILMTTPTEYFGGWKVKTGRVDVLGVFDLTGSAVRVTRTMIGVQIPLRTATTP